MKNWMRVLVQVVVALVASVGTAQSANVTWVGPNNSFWDLAGNWNPGLPGAPDDVLLGAFNTEFRSGVVSINTFTGTGTLTISGGQLSVANVSSTGGLTMTGGSLGGAGTVTISGATTWTAGTMTGAGTTNANGGLTLSGDGLKDLTGGRTLNNTGTATVTNVTVNQGRIRTGSGATINNSGTWQDQNANNSQISNDFGGAASTFNNTGTYTKSGNSTTAITIAFNNTSSGAGTGVVNVNAGRLDLSGGGTSNGSFAGTGTLEFGGGTYTLTAPSSITTANAAFSGGTNTVGGSYSVAGTTTVSGGTTNFTGTVANLGGSLVVSGGEVDFNNSAGVQFTTINMSGGTIGGVQSVTATGATTWTAGTMTGAGTTNANGGLTLSGDGLKDLTGGRTLNNTGTATVTNVTVNQGRIRTGSGATINNSGTWQDQNTNNSQISNDFGGAASTFNNTGTYTKSGNSTTAITIAFNNTSSGAGTGVVNVNAGRLDLSGGGTSNGSFAGTGTLEFGGGTYTLTAPSSITTANAAFSGGTNTVGGSYSVAGTTTVSGGTTNFTGTVANLGGSLVVSGGEVDFNNSAGVQFTTINMSGGTIGGVQSVTATGATTWTAGTMTGAGTTNANGGLTLSGDGLKDLTGGRTLNNTGTATVTNVTVNQGRIRTGSGATINNSGTWQDQNANNSQISNDFGGAASTFNNTGTYTKSGNSVTSISIAFNNTSPGIVNVNAGTLQLSGGGTSNGTFNIGGAGTLDFSGGTYNLNNASAVSTTGLIRVSGATLNTIGTLTSGGQLQITSGTLNANGPINAVTYNQSGGVLDGTGTVTVSGLTTWTAGTMTDTGTTNANGGLTLSGDGLKDLTGGRTLNNTGTATVTNVTVNQGRIRTGGGATINNSGTWQDQNANNSQISNDFGGAASTFNNTGTYTKSGNSVTSISIAFNNTSPGIVNVNAGTLQLSGGGTSNGTFNIGGSSTLDFSGGTYTLNNAAVSSTGLIRVSGATLNTTGTLTSGGQLQITSGTLNANGPVNTVTYNQSGGVLDGTGTVTVSGLATWTAGTMTDTGTTIANGGLTLSGDGLKDLTGGRTLNNTATATWTNATVNQGRIRTGGGATINNSGTWQDQNAVNNQISNDFGGAQSTFNNTGTYTKTGVGQTSMTTINFTNSGTVNANAGILNVSNGIQGSSGTINIGASGAVTLGAPSTVGTLSHNGSSGTSLTLGTDTITVSTDYNNANFGTGNAFNRRANVSTSGSGNRIIASGDANQGLTGSGVTNGNSATPTLTIGNVHLGANTINYNIVNTGTTGPALRGAVQTSVNGANLTDGRLSGSGVNQGNWGPVVTGGTLSRDVTITINTAGVYTPLAGQSVNILNNFDNTRSQLLTIQSTGGAAAYRLAEPNAIAPVNFGNVLVGSTQTRTLTISNQATADGFSEGLNAAFGTFSGTGASLLSGSGSITNLAAGTSNTTTMVVTLNTSATGTVTATGQILLASNGAGTSGLGITPLTTQVINIDGLITGVVGSLAQASSATPNPVNFGKFRVGDPAPPQQTLSISNIATAPAEGLNASIATASAGFNAGGSISSLAPGATNNTSLAVGFTGTGTAGGKNGTATITLASDGTFNSGTTTPLPSQTVNMSAEVYRLAQASPHTPEPVALGSVHVGGVATTALTISNTAANDGFSEKLNASIGGATAGVTASGSFALLSAGATNNSSLIVGLDTLSAGHKSGTATISLASDGTGTSGFSALSIGTQTVNVTGDVYNLAAASVTPSPVTLANQHVGGGLTQALTVANTAPAGAFTETLSAGFASSTGNAIHNGGTVSGIEGGANNNSALQVRVDTSAAGLRTGTVTVALTSNAVNGSGLGGTPLTSQVLNVSGNVYRLAQANTVSAVNFGSVHVGDTVQQALSISNQAANDGFSEKLNASFGGTSDVRITTNGGSISLLGPGATNTTSMIVGINTGAVGVVSGTATVNFVSDGTGTSGLGTTNLPSQNVGVSATILTGTVFRLAQPSEHTPEPVNLGNVHVGGSFGTQALTISNQAPNDGFSESLNASIGGATGAATTNNGSFTLLAAQATNSTSLVVGLGNANTTTAGAKTGTATITLVSDGTGTSGLGQTPLTPQTVNVTGNVYRLAAAGAHSPEPVSLGNVHVGSSFGTQALSVQNTAANDGFSEKLNASIGGATGAATATGSFTLLGPQATDSSNLVVGLGGSANTATVGHKTGTATISFVSDGTGTSGLGQTALTGQNQTVNVSGDVYRLAQASSVGPVNFGIVHVGDTVQQALSISNQAANDGFSEKLNASFGGTSDVRITTNGGSISLLGPEATNNTSMTVGINTAAAGVIHGTATINAASDGAGTSGLGITGLSPQSVTLDAQVNNFADAIFQKSGGSGIFSRNGSVFTLDFGNLVVGSGDLTAELDVKNDVIGPADFLDGLFDVSGALDLTLSGFGPITNLGAGETFDDLLVALQTSSLGRIQDSVVLSWFGHNASGFRGDPEEITLLVMANIIEGGGGSVPEPDSLALALLALLALCCMAGGAVRTRRAHPEL